MRRGVIIFIAGLAIGAAGTLYYIEASKPANAPAPLGASWSVYFSPRGGCTAAIVAEIGKAKSNIIVQAYSFTSEPIAAALLAAQRRGIAVAVIVDKAQEGSQHSQADEVAAAGARVLVDRKHAIAHNKVMVIDGATVITGSFNFSAAAETRNAENVLIVHDTAMAAKYSENWQRHADHSEPLTR
jgi:phosphatidylserine/phosphatidylglycerophosphate/cardiolipin synthase-like enzyme